MKKVQNKKGFTLAELLVVVAILAILVAVAIPVFGGTISSAKQTAIDANVRAIRAAATTKILTDDAIDKDGPWLATATIGDDGEMSGLTVDKDASAESNEDIPTPSEGVPGLYKVAIAAVN